jgi:hypothetical protein
VVKTDNRLHDDPKIISQTDTSMVCINSMDSEYFEWMSMGRAHGVDCFLGKFPDEGRQAATTCTTLIGIVGSTSANSKSQWYHAAQIWSAVTGVFINSFKG